MNLSLIGRMKVIIKYICSSYLSIETLLLSLLLFLILIVNLKRDNKMVQVISIGVYIGFVIGILISYSSYVKTCFDSFVKEIMNYIYFPSTIVYFFIIIFVTFMILWTLFSKKISKVKKLVNYFFFSILYYFFMSFIALATYDAVDLVDTSALYENDTILSLVQMSNFLLLVWLLITAFYWLYKYFQKKYD